MKILHINVSAICDRFYLKFFGLLKQQGILQDVVVPFDPKNTSRFDVEYCLARYKREEIDIVLLPVKKKIDRLLYGKKIQKYVNSILTQKGDRIKEYDVSHAHSLYSDGGVAYELYKRYGIPYLVAVRSTDTGVFMKYFTWLAPKARRILENAAHVVFISPDLKRMTVQTLYPNQRVIPWEEKCSTIPNGVDEFWIENMYCDIQVTDQCKTNKISAIQVSRLNKGKNVDKTVLAVKELCDQGMDVHLSIVGQGDQESRLRMLIKENQLEHAVDILGFIDNKAELMKEYRKSNVFVMPSQSETLGIVYIEALTQALPVIGLYGTGVSGYLQGRGVGAFVSKPEPKLIANAMRDIASNSGQMRQKCTQIAKEFEWNEIIRRYIRIYESTSGGNNF